MEADLSAQNVTKPNPTSDMWVTATAAFSENSGYVEGRKSQMWKRIKRLGVVLQADEEGLHHSKVHREAFCSAALCWCCVQSAGSVRSRQKQRYPVSDPGLRWGGGPDGGQPTAQRTRTTTPIASVTVNQILSQNSFLMLIFSDISLVFKKKPVSQFIWWWCFYCLLGTWRDGATPGSPYGWQKLPPHRWLPRTKQVTTVLFHLKSEILFNIFLHDIFQCVDVSFYYSFYQTPVEVFLDVRTTCSFAPSTAHLTTAILTWL